MSELTTMTATVETVDTTAREVLLRGEGGNLVTVKAGPEVRNLAQVRSGDRVVLDYQEAIAVEIVRAGDTRPPVGSVAAAGRAEPGQRPAGIAGEAVRVRVRIDTVDARAGAVTFTGPRGVTRRVVVREPEMRDFVRGLRPGEEVDIVYAEALAVRVEPATR
ncbi:hypothetical protein JMJ55_27850 [Belnapia sp. T6]|uniref:Uncharacterized protein n=1 Tax=Belnapia mucosa TaxID=2804532 RepID=A0ABS1VDD9_9PROT|nr:hypothetical protein [Belnapia mucosa]MBL6459141.1 hypothetical protein [Belnapia mucosa]